MRKNPNKRTFFCSEEGGVHSFTHSLCHCLTLYKRPQSDYSISYKLSLWSIKCTRRVSKRTESTGKTNFYQIKSHNLIILQTCGHARLVHVSLASLKSPKLDKTNLNTRSIKKKKKDSTRAGGEGGKSLQFPSFSLILGHIAQRTELQTNTEQTACTHKTSLQKKKKKKKNHDNNIKKYLKLQGFLCCFSHFSTL